MKNLIKSLVIIAISAMTLVACQKEESVSFSQTLKLTVDAMADDLASDGRTYIDNENNILWGTGEQMTIALLDETPQFVNSTSTDAYDGLAKATFEFEIEPAENSTFTYGGVYPASASNGISNENAAAYKVLLAASQKATATSYDPSAYMLIAKPVQAEQAQTSLQMSYRRITALNKITLTGLNDDVKSVTITVPEDQDLAGRRYLDLTTGATGEVYNGQSSSITVEYDTALSGASKEVWFSSWGASVAAGEELTIKATTATHIYTRTITANENGISFKEGYLNKLSINMAAADVEVTAISSMEGTYVVVALQAGTYYAMSANSTATAATAKLRGYQILNDFATFVDGETYPTTDADLQWTITKEGDNYVMSNNSQYLYWDSGDANNAKLQATPYAIKVVLNDDMKTYTISSVNTPARILAKNNTAANGFGFYAGTQTKALYLKKVAADTRTALATPTVTATVQNQNEIVVSWNEVANAGSYEVTCGEEEPQTITDALTCTFTDLEYETTYQISVVAKPADTSAYKASEAGTTSVMTEEDPNPVVPGTEAVVYEATFNNSGEYRTSGSNSYSVTENTYLVSNVLWHLVYTDCVTSGSPLDGVANIMARVARNTTNSPYVYTNNLLTTSKEVTKVTFMASLGSNVTLKVYYSTDGTEWNELSYEKDTIVHSTYGYTATVGNITTADFRLKFQWSVASSTSSHRDNKLDNVTVYGK